MKNNFIWDKQLIDGQWYFVCLSDKEKHIPAIKLLKDGNYSVRNNAGKSITCKDLASAKKVAIETSNRMKKFNKKFDKEN